MKSTYIWSGLILSQCITQTIQSQILDLILNILFFVSILRDIAPSCSFIKFYGRRNVSTNSSLKQANPKTKNPRGGRGRLHTETTKIDTSK